MDIIVPLTDQFKKNILETLLMAWIGNNILIDENNHTKK